MTAPRLLLTAAVAASAALLLALTSDLTFFLDEWDFLLDRRPWDAGSFLDSHGDHVSIVPVLLYKLGVTVFGMDSQRPFQVLLTALVCINAVLVFAWARPRVGEGSPSLRHSRFSSSGRPPSTCSGRFRSPSCCPRPSGSAR